MTAQWPQTAGDLGREGMQRRIDELTAEIERLRAALRPFAEADIKGIISLDEVDLAPEHFERARAAITKVEEGK